MTARETITFSLDGKSVDCIAGEPLIEVARREGVEIPAFATSRPRRRRQLPRLHGRDRRRAGAGAVVLPQRGAGHEGHDDERARAARAEDRARTAAGRHARARLHALQRARRPGPRSSASAGRFPAREHRRRTCRTRRSRSTLMPASNARAACAPAATSRSTTSSAWRSGDRTRRSCSTWTTPWAHPPASPAANACRPAPPVP